MAAVQGVVVEGVGDEAADRDECVDCADDDCWNAESSWEPVFQEQDGPGQIARPMCITISPGDFGDHHENKKYQSNDNLNEEEFIENSGGSTGVVLVVSFNGVIKDACSQAQVHNEWQVVEELAGGAAVAEENGEEEVEADHCIGEVGDVPYEGLLAVIAIDHHCPVASDNLEPEVQEPEAGVEGFPFKIQEH